MDQERLDEITNSLENATPAAEGGPAEITPPSSLDIPAFPTDSTLAGVVGTQFSVNGTIIELGTTGNKLCRDFAGPEAVRLVVISGAMMTRNTGTVSFSVRDFACIEDNWGFSEPAQVQVTPRTESPALVTARAVVTEQTTHDKTDVVITVHAWDVNGQPLPNLGFYWMCIVPYGTAVD